MKKSRRLATLAIGLSLGLAGFGPAALAMRDLDDHDHEHEATSECSTEMSNDSDNSTGDSEQSGLININNIGLQGLNLDLLGNLLCQGVFLNDLVAGVLGSAEGGDGGGGSEGESGCSTSQENESENETGESEQSGLVNLNNVVLQGNNLDVLGNLLCGGNFLNGLTAAVLGSAENDGGGDGYETEAECATDQDNDSDNDTGESDQDGLVNGNNVGLQGNNLDVLGNALCAGNFLNGLTAAVLGSAENDGDGGYEVEAECSTDQDNDSENETGDSSMGGLLNLNNIVLQGDNVAVLSNGLCGSIFLNDILVSILGIL